MNEHQLEEEQKVALVDLTRLVFKNGQPLKLDELIINDTETNRTFMINLEISEVGMMTAGIKGKSKVN